MSLPKLNPSLQQLISSLAEADATCFLVHEAGALALGLSYSPFVRTVDLCLVKGRLAISSATAHEAYTTGIIGDVPVRIWGRASLNLRQGIRVVTSQLYHCHVLAPDLLLERMDYSPDAASLLETRALLAAVVHVDDLTDDQLTLVKRYVRGL